jgi:16S rRNA (adenine1518-N6/adenine1519-N6)-dimethyltransferase
MAHPKDILAKLDANARKSLSQNFLTSPHWAESLTSAVTEGEPPKAIWEVGPGLGALTQLLLKKAKVPVTLFEYDKKLSAFLRSEYPGIHLIEGDVLKAPLVELAQSAGKVAVLSNLPYHLSSPVFFRLVDLKPFLTRVVLTFQKEFAERLLARVGQESYGALSIIAQLHFKITNLGILPSGAFYPPPAVASQAVILEPQNPRNLDLENLCRVIKAGFLHPRKKMVSNLKQIFPEVDWAKTMEAQSLSPNTRAEELNEEQWIQLSQAVKSSPPRS